MSLLMALHLISKAANMPVFKVIVLNVVFLLSSHIAHWAAVKMASALAVDCHTGLCIHGHPKRMRSSHITT